MEAEIVAELGGIYSPYTLEHFANTRETDIEHIVARSEAHDSGLCATDPGTRRRFASDLLNLTLAEPSLNRHDKRDHDAAGWLPPMNRCWFANRVVEVRRKYDLTIDRHEADVLERFALDLHVDGARFPNRWNDGAVVRDIDGFAERFVIRRR